VLAYANVLEILSRERERERERAVDVVNSPLPESKKESFHLSGR
jgi:hypothetical protein